MRRASVALCFLFLCAPAWADDSSVSFMAGGSAASMADNPSVRMLSEKVDITIGWEEAKVRCEFQFKNEGPAAKVHIGFPEEAHGDVGSIDRSDFKYFKSWVDGRIEKTRFVPSNGHAPYRAWHVKDVHFNPGQTRMITDEYVLPFGYSVDGDRVFVYVLWTGKSWKGKIGRADITVTVPADVLGFWKPFMAYGEKDLILHGTKAHLRLDDFEPTEDINVFLTARYQLRIKGANDNAPIYFRPEMYIKHHACMAGVWYLSDVPGLTISWNNDEKSCLISYKGHSLCMGLGSNKAKLDGRKEIKLPMAPYIEHENNDLYVPMVEVARALGIQASMTKAK